MLDRLKPAWRMYKCQQGMERIPTMEILALLEEGDVVVPNHVFTKGRWSLGLFVLLFLMTCCQGG